MLSHEEDEAETNPTGTGWQGKASEAAALRPLIRVDKNTGEVGDVCNGTDGSMPAPGGYLSPQFVWDQANRVCSDGVPEFVRANLTVSNITSGRSSQEQIRVKVHTLQGVRNSSLDIQVVSLHYDLRNVTFTSNPSCPKIVSAGFFTEWKCAGDTRNVAITGRPKDQSLARTHCLQLWVNTGVIQAGIHHGLGNLNTPHGTFSRNIRQLPTGAMQCIR
jgi:hypothetical protein